MSWLWPVCACGLLIDHRGSFLMVGEKLWIKKIAVSVILGVFIHSAGLKFIYIKCSCSNIQSSKYKPLVRNV